MTQIEQLGSRAKAASRFLAALSAGKKIDGLHAIAQTLEEHKDEILRANGQDMLAAKENGMKESMLDRLMLDEKRIASMAQAVRDVAKLEDPIGETLHGFIAPNGMNIRKVRVPLGVIGIIYEARPNVTPDAASLCLKSSNAVILKGGKEAIESNRCMVNLMRQALEACGIPADAVQLIEDTSRESTRELMKCNRYVDILIPRGGAGLIQSVVQNATVPVIETGTGNCHIYIDKDADLAMGVEILYNAKTSRPSVCNAAESLLVHKDVAEAFLPLAKQRLDEMQVEWRGCERVRKILGNSVLPATEEDYGTEFLDFILSAKVVDSLDQAIEHITRYGTGHSEAIVTQNLRASEEFTSRVDAAAVYVNASTRFTDGGEFGLGAEIGISTQKLHARGPMGLKEMTTKKYKTNGGEQFRSPPAVKEREYGRKARTAQGAP